MFTTHRKVATAVPPGGDILDTFTAANGTAIESRPADSGHIWTNLTGGSIAIQDNSTYPAVFTSGETVYRIGETPSADFTYSVTCHPVLGITGYIVGFYLRIADNDNYVMVSNYVRNDRRIAMQPFQKVNGSRSSLVSSTTILYGDNPFVMDMVVSGSNLIIKVNGTAYRNVDFNSVLTSPNIGIGYESGNPGSTDYRDIQQIETISV